MCAQVIRLEVGGRQCGAGHVEQLFHAAASGMRMEVVVGKLCFLVVYPLLVLGGEVEDRQRWYAFGWMSWKNVADGVDQVPLGFSGYRRMRKPYRGGNIGSGFGSKQLFAADLRETEMQMDGGTWIASRLPSKSQTSLSLLEYLKEKTIPRMLRGAGGGGTSMNSWTRKK